MCEISRSPLALTTENSMIVDMEFR